MNTEIKTALPKLTIKEIELLGLTHLQTNNNDNKDVTLRVYYDTHVGDSSSHEECVISKDNPFLKDMLNILEKLSESDYVFCYESYFNSYQENILTKTEFQLMCLVSELWEVYDECFDDSEEDYEHFYKCYNLENNEKNEDYIWEFNKIIFEEYEYSSLRYVNYEIR